MNTNGKIVASNPVAPSEIGYDSAASGELRPPFNGLSTKSRPGAKVGCDTKPRRSRARPLI